MRKLAPSGADPDWWRLLVRDAVTYPETIALTSVLTDDRTRQRLLADTGGHLPHTLAYTPGLITELARVTRRPWLAGRIASTSAGPLLVWVHHCSRAEAGPAAADRLWTLHMAHRPRSIDRELTAYKDENASSGTWLYLGLRHISDRAFTTGLAHARAYAASMATSPPRSTPTSTASRWAAGCHENANQDAHIYVALTVREARRIRQAPQQVCGSCDACRTLFSEPSASA
ncbi:hypothetical protein AB0K80_21110 [Streptomyces sp. NPDC052682]|uniref:hypothetical protein n=1 Tax=Streptomyces sp. NPDC052682 TaxID=3154954 RepID=UPI00343E54D4